MHLHLYDRVIASPTLAGEGFQLDEMTMRVAHPCQRTSSKRANTEATSPPVTVVSASTANTWEVMVLPAVSTTTEPTSTSTTLVISVKSVCANSTSPATHNDGPSSTSTSYGVSIPLEANAIYTPHPYSCTTPPARRISSAFTPSDFSSTPSFRSPPCHPPSAAMSSTSTTSDLQRRRLATADATYYAHYAAAFLQVPQPTTMLSEVNIKRLLPTARSALFMPVFARPRFTYDDDRMVCMIYDHYVRHWFSGAATGQDYWSVADDFIAAKRPGKIDRSQYFVDAEDDSWSTPTKSLKNV
ncbi:hypothetical protein R3P38DRAFT_3278183 [Favolaschia claudopus]|uniref:Uncharacterized protein n=1 Tax=Favolaschia claudopus TaxID=2862362 RepID=A0AAW0AJB8_9AGAR